MSNIELYIAELEATGHTARAAQVRGRALDELRRK